MRIGFVSDVHVGNPQRFGGPVTAGVNVRGRLVLNTLRRALEEAAKQEVRQVIIPGDLFDTSRALPQHVREVQALFEAHPDIVFDVLVGNHDQESTQPGDNACAPLRAVPNVNVIEVPEARLLPGVTLLHVPFHPGPAHEWFPGAVAELVKGLPADDDVELVPRVLSFHLGVRDEKTAFFLQHASDAIDLSLLRSIMVEHRISYAAAGNWHDHRLWEPVEGQDAHRVDVPGPIVIQVGTLCPTGWNNPGLDDYGRLVILDTHAGDLPSHHSLQTIEIPGPRFVIARSVEEANKLAASAMRDCSVFLRIDAPPGEALAASRTGLEQMKAQGKVFAGEAVPDDTETREQAQQAGRVARSAETRDEAIAAFCATMPLDEDVPRQQVVDEVRQYIGRAT